MADETVCKVRSIVSELETRQREIGMLQEALLDILTDDLQDQWDEPAQDALLKLEEVQRSIGEAQIMLVEQIPVESDQAPTERPPVAPAAESGAVVTGRAASRDSSRAPAIGEEGASAAVTGTAANSLCPLEWLRRRKIRVIRVSEASGIDEAADAAALFLGENHEALKKFFACVRGRVIGASAWESFTASGSDLRIIKVIETFGTKMKNCGFLTAFRFFRGAQAGKGARPVVFSFAPSTDPRVRSFFEGGWLERYVFQVVRGQFIRRHSAWREHQFVRRVEVSFPNGRQTEFDVLVGLGNDRILLIECKSGQVDEFIDRFREFNRQFLRLTRDQGALVLAREYQSAEKSSMEELSGLSAIHFSELPAWVARVI